MRGHGWSDNDPKNHYHIDFFAHDLHELVTKLELGKFHIAAFSFGPFVALDYARVHPELIQVDDLFQFWLSAEQCIYPGICHEYDYVCFQ